MVVEYDYEQTEASDDVAAALRRLADSVERGEVSIGTGEEAETVTIPEEFEVEIEFEEDDDAYELEVELTWQKPEAVDEE